MYIYELPYEINKELCRILDHNEDWKELAGVHMKYSVFEVNVSIYLLGNWNNLGFPIAYF